MLIGVPDIISGNIVGVAMGAVLYINTSLVK